MHVEQCFCDELRPMETATKLALVMHRREEKKPTNTGRIGLLALAHSELFVRGHADAPADLSTLVTPERRLLLLFPREDAVPLTSEFVAGDPRPITLIVPDGTWSQARRCVQREPVLAAATAVIPPEGPETRYRLRTEHVPGGLGTGEAIARAFGVLEGPEVQAELERIFDLQVERTLATRQPPVGTPNATPSDG